MEIFFGSTPTIDEIEENLKNYYPFGCPAYVLAPKIQDSKKSHKWEPRARQVVYLGRYNYYASPVFLILNKHTIT